MYHASLTRACSPVSVSSAEQTLLNEPLPSSCKSLYRSPTCKKSDSLGIHCTQIKFQACKSGRVALASTASSVSPENLEWRSQPTRHRPQSRPQACSCSALCWRSAWVLREAGKLLQAQPALLGFKLQCELAEPLAVLLCVGLGRAWQQGPLLCPQQTRERAEEKQPVLRL